MGSGDFLPQFAKLKIAIKIFHKKTKLGLGTLWEIKKYLKQEQIELVHTHLFAADTWGRLSALMAKVPVIVSTEHNINLDEGKIKKIVKKILSYLNQKIIAVSSQVKTYQVEVEKISEHKIIVINNGIDLARFPYQTALVKKDSFLVLGILGRLELQKGHEVAIKALKELAKEGFKTQLIIKGSGSLKDYLIKKTEELDLKNVFWEEPEAEVNHFYQHLDCLIIPSLWEGCGLVALEAMASGVLVIASNVGGLSGIIKDKHNGFLFTAGDYVELAEKIKNIIANSFFVEKIKANARSTVEQNFNINKTVKQYQNLYLKLLYEIKN